MRRISIRIFGILLLLVLMLFSITGCALFGGKKPTNVAGQLKIILNIPQEKGPLASLSLDKAHVWLSKSGSETIGGTADITGSGPIVVSFPSVPEGTWQIAAVIADTDDYDCYSGKGTVTIIASQSATQTVTLNALPGNLSITVNVPQGLGIAKGTVTLLGGSENIPAKDFTVSGASESILFENLKPTTYTVKLSLMTAGGTVVTQGQGVVDVRPSRNNPVTVNVTGSLSNLSVTFNIVDEEPSAPTGLMANRGASGVTLTWTASTSPDVNGYAVYRSEGPGLPKTRLNDSLVTVTNYIDVSVEPAKTYYYWVQAYNSKQFSSPYSEYIESRPSVYFPAGKIVYNSNRGGPNQVFKCNADGTNEVQLTSEYNPSDTPVISPDGSLIAYVYAGTGFTNEIYIMNSNGGGKHHVPNITVSGNLRNPAWSPDGTKLAFTVEYSNPSNDADIYVINIDGTGLRQLTDNDVKDNYATWSHDGQYIAFQSEQPDQTTGVYRVKASDGTDLTTVIDPADHSVYRPRYHPASDKILVYSRMDSALYTVDGNGGNWTRIVGSEGCETFAWSSDGSYVIFDASINEKQQLFRLDSTGGTRTQITGLGPSPENCFEPSWGIGS